MYNSLHFVVVIVDCRDLSNNQLKNLSSGALSGMYLSSYSHLNL